MKRKNSHDDPEGFKRLYRSLRDGQVNGIELLIPFHLHEILEAEERAQQELQAQLDHKREEEELSEAPSRKAGSPGRPKTYQQQQKEEEEERERADALAQEALWAEHAAMADRKRRRESKYSVFQPEQALALYRRMRRYTKDERDRFQRAYAEISATGHLRPIASPSAEALANLAATQPHMVPVVAFVQDQLELARRARKPLRIPPILLVGEAGTGKTHFAQSLANALRAPINIQRLDTDLTSSLFLGSDRKWSTSQHGLLFELLALGKSANPVIVLDEIDKVNRVDQRVQASLYSLLEPVSAKQVRDISLEFELDASLVTWVATANEATRLDTPLRSRFKEFHIQVPTAEQCLVLAREVIRATIRSAGVRGFSLDTNRLECELAHLPARQIQQITRETIARALKAGRMSLQRQDLPPGLVDSDESRGRSSGYLH